MSGTCTTKSYWKCTTHSSTYENIHARFFRVAFLGVLGDLFRGENVTSIWEIKRSRMEEADGIIWNMTFSGNFPTKEKVVIQL